MTIMNIMTEEEIDEQEKISKSQAKKEKRRIKDLTGKSKVVIRASKQTDKAKSDASNANILGYTMLSNRKSVFCPIYVGCIYQNTENSKFYLKVRKMMYQIPFLLNFISISPQSGNHVDLLNGSQRM
jgi:hypothetical protein